MLRRAIYVWLTALLAASIGTVQYPTIVAQQPSADTKPAEPAAAKEIPAAEKKASPPAEAKSRATAEPKPAGSAAAKSDAPSVPQKPSAPWEYSPYRIQVWLAAPSSAECDAGIIEGLQREVERLADAVIGAPWTLTVTPPPERLRSSVAYSPEMITDTVISAVDKELLKGDKVFVVSLRGSAREISLRVRELDCHTRSWGPLIVHEVRQPEMLGHVIFDSILEAFSPLARIEEGQVKTCVVRSRAGGLILDHSSPVYIGKGNILQPIFRQNDRYGEPVPGRTMALPFTFLHITSEDENSPGLLQCNVHSAMRGPVNGRSASRRERWAVKVRATMSATELIVETQPAQRNQPTAPLPGVEIYSKTPVPEPPKPETEEEQTANEKKNPPELLGVTDWRGSLIVPVGGPELRVMYIKNGGLLLARLPIVAGYEKQVIAEVPDDNPRLQAEGHVNGMNGEITDLVVQRQIIRMRARKKMAEGKLEDAQKLIEEFRALKTPSELQSMLDQHLQRQRPASNPGVRIRIDKLYADERETIAKYVDVEMLNQLSQELQKARASPVIPDAAEGTEPKEKKGAPSALQPKGENANAANAVTANNPANPSTPGGPSPSTPQVQVPAGSQAPMP